jgi:hypothetical protein
MKHAYVILDNDNPLYVAETERVAEDAIDRELGNIEFNIRRANGDDEDMIQRKLAEHHLHFVMVPYVVALTRRSN